MKTIVKISAFILFLSFISTSSFAQKKVEEASFMVEGVCGMCKDRIENAALIKGVKLAEWDQKSSLLKVIYKTKKVSLDDIHSAVSGAGHKTEKLDADQTAYKKLPGCCAYDDGVEKH